MYKIVLTDNNETNKKNLTDWIGLLVNMGRVGTIFHEFSLLGFSKMCLKLSGL